MKCTITHSLVELQVNIPDAVVHWHTVLWLLLLCELLWWHSVLQLLLLLGRLLLHPVAVAGTDAASYSLCCGEEKLGQAQLRDIAGWTGIPRHDVTRHWATCSRLQEALTSAAPTQGRSVSRKEPVCRSCMPGSIPSQLVYVGRSLGSPPSMSRSDRVLKPGSLCCLTDGHFSINGV